MTDRFNAVVVRVEHKGGVVVGVIMSAQPRSAIVASACSDCRSMKGVYGSAIGRAKAQVNAWVGSGDAGFHSYCKFNTGRARRRTIVGAAAAAEIDDANEPERTQNGIVKPAAALKVRYAQRNMIQHARLLIVSEGPS